MKPCNYHQRCLLPFEKERCIDNYARCIVYQKFKILDFHNPEKSAISEIEKKITIFGNEELK
jgi:hypothetical protein